MPIAHGRAVAWPVMIAIAANQQPPVMNLSKKREIDPYRSAGRLPLVSDKNISPAEDSDQRFEKIATLDNEVEAQLLDAVLNDRRIPHLMVTYFDSVYSGVFQGTGGWGRIESSAQFRDEIMAIIEEIKNQAPPLPPETEGTSSEENSR